MFIQMLVHQLLTLDRAEPVKYSAHSRKLELAAAALDHNLAIRQPLGQQCLNVLCIYTHVELNSQKR